MRRSCRAHLSALVHSLRTLLAFGRISACSLSVRLVAAASVPNPGRRGSRSAGDYLPRDYSAVQAASRAVPNLARASDDCSELWNTWKSHAEALKKWASALQLSITFKFSLTTSLAS